ncbi:hypothetical protein BGW80DRAFT_1463238 [Lactifluus volemus]|nr:hypothetical protein BGW80DRAFT_1463238 [Lactifluus volemus]
MSCVANPRAPDKKHLKQPSSEVKEELECKKELQFRSKILEQAKIKVLAAMEVEDTLSNSLGSKDGEEERHGATTATDVNDIIGSQDPATPIKVESEGESDSEGEGDDDNGVIMMVTASIKETLAKNTTRAKRPSKEEVRVAVDAARKEIKAERKRHLVAESTESGLRAR